MSEIGGKLININLKDNGLITRTRIIRTQYAKQRVLEEQKMQAVSSTFKWDQFRDRREIAIDNYIRARNI